MAFVYLHLIAVRVHREVFSPHSRQIPELDVRIVWVIIWFWFFAALSDTNLGCLFVEVFKAEKTKNKKATRKSKKTSAWNYLCNLSHCIALTYVKGVVA